MWKNHDAAVMQADELLKKMTLQEKAGQICQKLYGFRGYEVVPNSSEISLSKDFTSEFDKYGSMGVLYGLYRADPWSERTFENGLYGDRARTAYNLIQKYALEHARLHIPIMISTECPHGQQSPDGYLLPVNLAMGAGFDPDAVYKAYQECGKQMYDMGVHVALVSMLDILRDPRWGRSEECYSEDPYLAARLAEAAIRGIQDTGVAVCAKHFCAQGQTTGGVNASAAIIGERELREIHFPVMQAAVNAGVKCVMASYNEIDGIPCHANSWLLQDVLRNEMGFDGIIMADGLAIDNLKILGGGDLQACAGALRAGIEVGLWDQAFERIEEACELYPDLLTNVDAAVRRILTLKYELGLFEHPYLNPDAETVSPDKTAGLRLAESSVVLLKNEAELLPLNRCEKEKKQDDISKNIDQNVSKEKISKIAVIGPDLHDIYRQLGDYTPPLRKGEGKTVLEALLQETPVQQGKVKLNDYSVTLPVQEADLQNASAAAENADAVILVLSGSSSRYGAQREGKSLFDANGAIRIDEQENSSEIQMDCGEGIDSAELQLPGNQIALLRYLHEKNIPIITVLIAGRPYAMQEIAKYSNALLVSFYPGPQGGTAIAGVLFGKYSPSGRLPASLPRSAGQLPVYYNYRKSYQAMHYSDLKDGPVYVFGEGMSFSGFQLEQYELQKISSDCFHLKAVVANIGRMDAYEVLQLYIQRTGGSIVPRIRELAGFRKVFIPKGKSCEVVFEIGFDQLSVWNRQMHRVIEAEPVRFLLCDGVSEWQTGSTV